MTARRPDIAIVYDRIRPEERLLFDAFERLGVEAEHRYAPHEVHALSGERAADLPLVALQRCVAQTRGLAL
ncbi:MAG: 30S ribosomal protein S6--L-glutamate ligase, partial [Trueperaceae bacterium]